jgi:uncharacterized protein YjiS (DUF1127 family)
MRGRRIDMVEQPRGCVLKAGSTVDAPLMNHSLQTSRATLALQWSPATAFDPEGSISARPLVRWLATPWLWYQRVGWRHDLAQLDDRQLDDIGLTRDQVVNEHGKHFWQD